MAANSRVLSSHIADSLGPARNTRSTHKHAHDGRENFLGTIKASDPDRHSHLQRPANSAVTSVVVGGSVA